MSSELQFRNQIIFRKEMAERLGVTERTLLKWHNKGLFKYRKDPAGRAFYTEGDYIDYLEDSKKRVVK